MGATSSMVVKTLCINRPRTAKTQVPQYILKALPFPVWALRRGLPHARTPFLEQARAIPGPLLPSTGSITGIHIFAAFSRRREDHVCLFSRRNHRDRNESPTMSRAGNSITMKIIRDAIHGDMRFPALEVALIDTPVMQRLRGIKQLGTSYLVYPSAMHTRFEHSLGTCWLTRKLLETLHHAGHSLSAEDQQTACMAALLHDVTHVPFGHTFEDERRLFERHDQDRERLEYFLDQPEMARILRRVEVGERVRRLLGGEDMGQPFVRQLVMGTVCADLLDYLRRDALHCGLALAYDDRLFQYLHLVDGQLVVRLHKEGGFRRDALSELVHLLQIRYTLTERVYYHHAKVVAGAMVSRALELALASGKFARPELYQLRDDSLLDHLARLNTGIMGYRDLLEDLSARRLYKRVYLLTLEGYGRAGLTTAQRDDLAARFHSNLAERRALEQAIAHQLKIPEAHVIVYCPSPRMALKEAGVPVQIAPGNVVPLADLKHPDIDALKEKHRLLWRFYVCVNRRHQDIYLAAGNVCQDLLGHANQLEPLQRGKLAFGN